MRKDHIALDAWLKELAPSAAPRRRYHSHEADFKAFRIDYMKELAAPEKEDLMRRLAREAREGTVTLVLAKRDVEHSSARVRGRSSTAGDMCLIGSLLGDTLKVFPH